MYATRSVTKKRADMADQATTAPVASEQQGQVQPPVVPDFVAQITQHLAEQARQQAEQAKQQAERDERHIQQRAEQAKQQAGRDERHIQQQAEQAKQQAERDERHSRQQIDLRKELQEQMATLARAYDGTVSDLTEQTTSLREETSSWKVEMDERLKRLERDEPARALSTGSAVSAELSAPPPTSIQAARGSVRQRPPRYDGKTTWEAYLAQFEIAAALNEWNMSEKAAFLATSLDGSAANILGGLSADRRQNYTTLVTALETRFGSAVQKELNRVRLRSRRRQRGEPLVEVADDVERLARLAYNDTPVATQDTHAKEQFIDAITDDDLRVRVLQSRPTNLQEALRSALELESYTLAVRHTPTVRAMNGVPENDAVLDVPKLMEELVGRFTTSMAEQLSQVVNSGRPKLNTSNARPQSRGECWNCGDPGHYAYRCPQNNDGHYQQGAATTNAGGRRFTRNGPRKSSPRRQNQYRHDAQQLPRWQQDEPRGPWQGNDRQPTSGAEDRL